MKETLRRTMKERLRATTEEQRAAWSASILRWLHVDDSWLVPGRAVAFYGGLKAEPDLWPLVPWLGERGVSAVLFAIEDDALVPYHIRSREDIVPGVLGVFEPKRSREAKMEISDLGTVLVPALAFGRNDGSRLGRGKGYYDRLIAALPHQARAIGVGFDVQFVSDIPCDEHDARMGAMVSEIGWIEVD